MLIRAGIIGPGAAGTLHADALRRIGVEIAAVAALTPELARRDAERLGVPQSHVSAEALVADERIDVVHVCTPNSQHYAHCRVALEAGKHVVAEKPLTTSVANAAELLRLAEQAGVVHALCHGYRYYPMVQALRELVARGQLGRVRAAHGTWLLEELLVLDPSHWMLDPEQMGPALTLADTGIHWWDLVEHTTGAPIREVLCETLTRPRRIEGEDTAALVLRLDGGILATGIVCQAAPGHGNTVTLELIGERRAAAWDIRDPNRLAVREVDGAQRVIERGMRPAAELGVGSRLPAGQPEGHADAIHTLLARVYAHVHADGLTGREDYPTFADGLHGLQVLDALLDSARTRSWSGVSDDGGSFQV